MCLCIIASCRDKCIWFGECSSILQEQMLMISGLVSCFCSPQWFFSGPPRCRCRTVRGSWPGPWSRCCRCRQCRTLRNTATQTANGHAQFRKALAERIIMIHFTDVFRRKHSPKLVWNVLGTWAPKPLKPLVQIQRTTVREEIKQSAIFAQFGFVVRGLERRIKPFFKIGESGIRTCVVHQASSALLLSSHHTDLSLQQVAQSVICARTILQCLVFDFTITGNMFASWIDVFNLNTHCPW